MIDAVLFDFRGTLFDDENDTAWLRNSAASIDRALDDVQIARTVEQLRAAEHEPHIAAALNRCDTSFESHRDANLAWFLAAGLDDELAIRGMESRRPP